MPSYKLLYFNARGRAETLRYLFALAGVKYEDYRMESDWPTLKETFTFAQCPVLMVDGVMITQSVAIGRFLAKRFGLAGKNDIHEAIVESIVIAVDEKFTTMAEIINEKDAGKKTAMHNKFKTETAPSILRKLEGIISANPSGYFVGDELTWADVIVFHLMTTIRLRFYSEADLDAYPKMVALVTKMKSLPKLAAWLANRPKTEF